MSLFTLHYCFPIQTNWFFHVKFQFMSFLTTNYNSFNMSHLCKNYNTLNWCFPLCYSCVIIDRMCDNVRRCYLLVLLILIEVLFVVCGGQEVGLHHAHYSNTKLVRLMGKDRKIIIKTVFSLIQQCMCCILVCTLFYLLNIGSILIPYCCTRVNDWRNQCM